MAVYEITNRPTTLEVDWFYLRRQVGRYMGYTQSPAEFDDQQNEVVSDIIDEGIRLYSKPPPLEEPYGTGEFSPHEWTWLRPEWQLNTQNNQRRYACPEDWERPIGDIAYRGADENNYYRPIKFASPARLRNMEWSTQWTHYPQWAALEPGELTGDAVQRWTLVLHPTPDAEYELSVGYQAFVRRPTEDHPRLPGGNVHSEGWLAACLAAAERFKYGVDGAMWRYFQERLAVGIAQDWRRTGDVLGFSQARGDQIWGRGSLRRADGIFYDDTTYANTVWSSSN